ncbi:MAG: hypothetical protein J0I06_16395 [Planctomycetes bacterium]|nr:hypothetical protein [Planctomycetota bacterium]
MVLIWSGAGGLVAMIWFVSILTGDRLTDAVLGPRASPRVHNLAVEWLAAALTLVLALALRTRRSVGVDPETGAEVVARPNHSLFWVPVNVWPAVFFALGVGAYYWTPAPAPALFEVTPPAADEARRAAAEKALPAGWYVRVEAYCKEGVHAPRYSLELVPDADPVRDYAFQAGGIKVVVLKRQVEMLRGATLDFGKRDGREKFEISNPNFEGERLEKWRRDLELERPPDPK